jgi:hypothetical protein
MRGWYLISPYDPLISPYDPLISPYDTLVLYHGNPSTWCMYFYVLYDIYVN